MLNYKEVVDCVVVAPDSKELEAKEIRELKKTINGKKEMRIGLDMESVQSLKNGFLDLIKSEFNRQKISLFNLKSELFVLLSLLKYDKYVNVYADINDFVNDDRVLVKRNFKVY